MHHLTSARDLFFYEYNQISTLKKCFWGQISFPKETNKILLFIAVKLEKLLNRLTLLRFEQCFTVSSQIINIFQVFRQETVSSEHPQRILVDVRQNSKYKISSISAFAAANYFCAAISYFHQALIAPS